MHPAIQLCLRHNGKVVLNRAIGHGWGNAPTDPPDAEKIPVKTDTPFCVYSSAKAITATVLYMLVERGQLSLDLLQRHSASQAGDDERLPRGAEPSIVFDQAGHEVGREDRGAVDEREMDADAE